MQSPETPNTAVLILNGQGVSRGVVMGRAIIMGASNLEVPHYLVDDIASECQRLDNALEAVRTELNDLIEHLPADAPKELAPLLNVHSLLVSDPILAQQTKQLIHEKSYNAEWALTTQGQVLANQFSLMQDDYIRERVSDIRQVIERVINVLLGGGNKPFEAAVQYAQDQTSIVVAHDISPADMMNMREAQFAGFLTDLGGATSHTAIVARGMGVPAVVGVGNACSLIRDHDLLILDGNAGVVIVNPSNRILRQYQKKEEHERQTRAYLLSQKASPAITLDRKTIMIEGNIELPDEVSSVLDMGGEGIGLFRTEFLFMGNRAKLPSEEEQYEAYSYVLKHMAGRPVTIRTLDLGADKTLNEESTVAVNPALGLRAIRYCLANPDIFQTQLRALLRASVYGHLRILVPMIAHMHEVQAVKDAMNHARQQLEKEGYEVNPTIEVGAMVETPAIAIAIDSFMDALDFVSIGTNDLIQYTLAIDRVDSEVSHLYDPLHPAIISLIYNTIKAGEKSGKSVSICGEMAGDSQFTRLLLGMGLKEFSMNPTNIPEIKHIIRQTHQSLSAQKVDQMLSAGRMIQLDSAGLIIE